MNVNVNESEWKVEESERIGDKTWMNVKEWKEHEVKESERKWKKVKVVEAFYSFYHQWKSVNLQTSQCTGKTRTKRFYEGWVQRNFMNKKW
jgi:hypothetical protein